MFIEVQTRTTINDPMRAKRGRISKTCLRNWYIWQIEALFCLEVFAEQQKSISILVFHSVLEVKLASLKIVRFDPPMLDLKYLLDTGTIRSGLWHVL